MPIGRTWAYRHAILSSYEAKCHYKNGSDDREDAMRIFRELSAQ